MYFCIIQTSALFKLWYFSAEVRQPRVAEVSLFQVAKAPRYWYTPSNDQLLTVHHEVSLLVEILTACSPSLALCLNPYPADFLDHTAGAMRQTYSDLIGVVRKRYSVAQPCIIGEHCISSTQPLLLETFGFFHTKVSCVFQLFI